MSKNAKIGFVVFIAFLVGLSLYDSSVLDLMNAPQQILEQH